MSGETITKTVDTYYILIHPIKESRGNITFYNFTLEYLFQQKAKSILFSTYLFFVFHGELWLMWSLRGQGHSANGEDMGKLDCWCISTKGHPTRKQTHFFEAICG